MWESVNKIGYLRGKTNLDLNLQSSYKINSDGLKFKKRKIKVMTFSKTQYDNACTNRLSNLSVPGLVPGTT